MVEQDIYWVLVFDRWILNQGQHLSEFFKSFTGSIAFDKFLYKQAGSSRCIQYNDTELL